jgi:hypothetical protein
MATAAIAKEENFMVESGWMLRMLHLCRSEIVSAKRMNLRTRIMRLEPKKDVCMWCVLRSSRSTTTQEQNFVGGVGRH